MKKFLMAIVLCLIYTLSFGQEWNKLNTLLRTQDINNIRYERKIDIKDRFVVVHTSEFEYENDTYYDSISNMKYDIILPNSSSYKEYSLEIPKVIYDEYKLGCNLYKGGIATISVGASVGVLGSIIYLSAVSNSNSKQGAIKSGAALMSIGGSLIGVSVPLFCWGDHLKRTANKDMELYSILKD